MVSLPEKVSTLITNVSADKILPRFRRLTTSDIEDKGGGDPVTVADLEAEQALTPALRNLLPGSTVIGEEAVFENSGLLDLLDGSDPVWIIDPVDGTKNFTRGSTDFVVIVALVQSRETIAGWIYQPTEGIMTIAEKGAGSFENDTRLATATAQEVSAMQAAVHTGNIVKAQKPVLDERAKCFKSNQPLYCAGLVYQQLARGDLDCAFYGRSKPWDHAAGALILSEAGGYTAFATDPHPYQPDHGDRLGLLAASSKRAWDTVNREIIGNLTF